MILPLILKNLRVDDLSAGEKKYADLLKGWDLRDDANSKGATVFERFWDNFTDTVYNDEYKKAPDVIQMPFESTLVEGLLKDSAYKFVDNIYTAQKETLADDVTAAFKKTSMELKAVEADGKLEWAKFKGTMIRHLLRIFNSLNRMDLPVGGGTNNINAAKPNHGPSWRMVVQLSPETEAWGVYPGGQNGNPGSKYYDTFVNDWAKGSYYLLWVMKQSEEKSGKVKWVMKFSK
jgi:penicillin amidase